MGELALLFPGQGSQAVGMGMALRAACARANELFLEAEANSGLPITALTELGPLDRLTETDAAQSAVVATSLAALTYLKKTAPGIAGAIAVAGHSVGEFAAFCAAGVLDETATLQLVAVRARAMAEACKAVSGTMAVVLSLQPQKVDEICERASEPGSVVELANDNAPGQVVISGELRAVQRASEASLAAGARRVLPLRVGGPFHSQYMRPAAGAISWAVGRQTFTPPVTNIVINSRAEVESDPGLLAEELCRQVYSPVRWAASLKRLQALGCDRFLEIGAGEVLAGLVRKTLGGARVVSFGEPAHLPAVLGLLG